MKSVRRAEQCTWQVLYHSPVHIHCIAATENSSEPLSTKILNPEDIHAYNCDEATKKKLWQHLNPPEVFRHMVTISEHCFAIFTEPSTSNPTGFCHVEMDGNGKLQCSNKNCNRKSGSSKQIKSKSICVHLHVLLCILKLPAWEQQQESSSTCSSASATAIDTPTPDATDSSLSVSRTSSINLKLTKTIPYPVPKVILSAFRMQMSWPTKFPSPDTGLWSVWKPPIQWTTSSWPGTRWPLIPIDALDLPTCWNTREILF